MRALGLKALPVLLLSACAVGPHYAGPPIVPASSQWAEPARTSEPEANWWQGLHDATLDRLVSEARGRNLDVRIAREQLLEARATARAAIGSRFPELDATGSVTRNEVSRNGEIPIGRIPGFPRRFNLFDAGFDASWEIDLWGHTARAVEAAEARSAAAADTALAIELETVAEVVSNYVTLRSAQARLASAEADEVARRQTAALVRARFEAGESSKVDLSRAESQADAAAGDVPGLRAQARAATYSLAVLTGRTPEASLTLDETPQPLPAPPPAVGAGLRSDVLRRRPDVRQAERELAAATADVGVAVADLFPRVTLVAAIGQQAQHGADLGAIASRRYQFGPSLSWPVFTAGRLRAEVHAYQARAGEAAARYEKTVLTALADSETALNRYAAAGLEREARVAAAEESSRAVVLARQRYAAGEDDLTTVLEAESEWHAAEQAAVAARAAELSQWASLHKALGGL